MATQRTLDKQKVERYLHKLEIARSSNEVNPFETKETQKARIEHARKDVVFMTTTYLPHYATAECAPFQYHTANAIANDLLVKIFLEWFRGGAKSVWADVIIPLWLWMRGEDVFMCLKSDSKERAEELLSDLQAELEANQLLINDFGSQKCEGDWEIGNFKTIDQRFIGMAFGIKQKVRGVRVKQRRPNLWVIDDLETPDTISNPMRMRKQADHIERDILPTMTGPIRRLLYANNKFARVMTQTILQERHPTWIVNQVKGYNKVTHEPAWPSMYSKEYYIQQEIDMGIVAAYAEYLHETKLEGKIFSEDQIQWRALPPLIDFKMIVAHWDIAYTDNEDSDYNAIKIWGLHENNFYLIDCYVKQSVMKKAVAWLADFTKRLPKGVNIIRQYESQFWNGEVQRSIDEIEDTVCINLNLMKINTPKVNKLMRMISMQPYYQNGRIYYNIDLKAHSDTQVGIIQLCAVEEGSKEHDDSPDADQLAISTLDLYSTPGHQQRAGEKNWRTGKMNRKYFIP
jgi:predicted phage terminase large subunit-like protein